MIAVRWLLRRFGLNLLVAILALTSLLSIFDLLANAGQVTSNGGGMQALLFYYMLRFPAILIFILPFAVLISALQTFSSMASHQEIVALLTGGCSLLRITLIFLTAVIGACILQFFFTNYIVTASVDRLAEWKARDYEGWPALNLFPEKPKWLASQNYIVYLGEASPDGSVLKSPTLIWRDQDGVMTRFIKAEVAHYQGGRWTMNGVSEQNLESWKVKKHESLIVDFELLPNELAFLNREVNVLRFSELMLLGSGRVETQLHSVRFYLIAACHRIAQPLAAVVMILLAAPVAMQLNRSGKRISFSIFALSMGFLYFLVERILLTLSEKGDIPMVLGLGGAHVLFGLIGLGCILHQQK